MIRRIRLVALAIEFWFQRRLESRFSFEVGKLKMRHSAGISGRMVVHEHMFMGNRDTEEGLLERRRERLRDDRIDLCARYVDLGLEIPELHPLPWVPEWHVTLPPPPITPSSTGEMG